MKLLYRFETEGGLKSKLKVEINSREHFAARELVTVPYQIRSRWFTGKSEVAVLSLPWLLGSKLRALYQRRKGRDLFDLTVVLQQGLITPAQIAESFAAHLSAAGQSVSRAEIEENLYYKIQDQVFLGDILPLLAGTASDFDLRAACDFILRSLISQIPGEPWKGVVQKGDGKHRKG